MSLTVNPSGRLIHFARKTSKMTVLLDNLWFANGVALSPNEDFLVVSDLARSKLIKYWLATDKAGEVETFTEGLPGIGDNLTGDKNGLWVALPLTADPQNPFIFQSMTRMPLARKFLARLLTLADLFFSGIATILPNDFTRSIAHNIGSTEMLSFLFSERSTILRLDWNGKIVKAYHAFDSAIYTHVMEMDGQLYLGSIAHNYIARVARKTHV